MRLQQKTFKADKDRIWMLQCDLLRFRQFPPKKTNCQTYKPFNSFSPTRQMFTAQTAFFGNKDVLKQIISKFLALPQATNQNSTIPKHHCQWQADERLKTGLSQLKNSGQTSLCQRIWKLLITETLRSDRCYQPELLKQTALREKWEKLKKILPEYNAYDNCKTELTV